MHFDKLSSLARFKASCPFLGRTKTSTLRTLCTSASNRYPTLSQLTERAAGCPVMGPALSMRSKQLAGQTAGYASVAGNAEMRGLKDSGMSGALRRFSRRLKWLDEELWTTLVSSRRYSRGRE